MSNYKFAAVLIAGLVLALPPTISTATAQQQPSPSGGAAKTKKEPTAGQTAARERQKKCAVEWKEAKSAGKTETGATWPKFWSACNKRLKAAAN